MRRSGSGKKRGVPLLLGVGALFSQLSAAVLEHGSIDDERSALGPGAAVFVNGARPRSRRHKR